MYHFIPGAKKNLPMSYRAREKSIVWFHFCYCLWFCVLEFRRYPSASVLYHHPYSLRFSLRMPNNNNQYFVLWSSCNSMMSTSTHSLIKSPGFCVGDNTPLWWNVTPLIISCGKNGSNKEILYLTGTGPYFSKTFKQENVFHGYFWR